MKPFIDDCLFLALVFTLATVMFFSTASSSLAITKYSKFDDVLGDCVTAAKDLQDQSENLFDQASDMKNHYEKLKEETLEKAKKKKTKKKKLGLPAGKANAKLMIDEIKEIRKLEKAMHKKCGKAAKMMKSIIVLD